MPIYTRTGDKGTTSLYDGTRVKKCDLRVETYGTFDEVCAQVSVAQKLAKNPEVIEICTWVQNKIFEVNADLATAARRDKLTSRMKLVSAEDVKQMESWIDAFTARLPKVCHFILPGATLPAAQLHVARTMCRRGERLLVRLVEEEDIRPEVSQFVNRLSDLLYIMARVEDERAAHAELVDEIVRRCIVELKKPDVS